VTNGATPSVRHLAFATADIFSAAEKLQRNGVEFLKIPENYCDDLQSEIDVPSQQLNALKNYDILYDRAGQGEYLQVSPEASSVASLSRSCNDADMRVTAQQMLQCASRPMQGRPMDDALLSG